MAVLKKIIAISYFAFAIPLLTFGAQLPNAVNSGVSSNTSLNWSGYVTTQGPFTSVNGTWTIPSVASAHSTMADATWVGIGGVTNHALIQAGTQALTDRQGGVAYQAWYELLPENMQIISLQVHSGDSISASITQTDADVWQISIVDNTTGDTYQKTVDYHSDLSSAEWIEEMPTANIGILPLDNFGSVSFSNGSAVENGAGLTIAETAATPLTMVTNDGAVLATPASLGDDGSSFTIGRSAVTIASANHPRYSAYSNPNPLHVSPVPTEPAPAPTVTIQGWTFAQQQILQFLAAQLGIHL
jgi:hypothetical protein